MANDTYNNPRAGSNSSKGRMKEMTDKVNIIPAYTGLEKLNEGDPHSNLMAGAFGKFYVKHRPSTQKYINKMGQRNQKNKERAYLQQALDSAKPKSPSKKRRRNK